MCFYTNSGVIWTLLFFALWHQHHIVGQAAGSDAFEALGRPPPGSSRLNGLQQRLFVDLVVIDAGKCVDFEEPYRNLVTGETTIP